ncbi:UDP-N-acetylglucosamine 1-carboxyvinyltransferase [Bianquea renquensis]|uniref:UDP-N-acetylglucosamine 1-carboxyvinyltransferase n=1 Tax=Bianquea renquensis TaxID=2763661 RepID=A0A926I206_9FIRM|nr:UDP-N-acetylglucosamine 1-carboxyvinyltransferase [Bianquea renquensis]MBC8543815.1 UDP-N-acetylglucosamine 1-carboxyvinyltransferase [Bianquea renquensis]
MKKISVRGGYSLHGQVKVQGSKNSVLPILAASVLTADEVMLENCPHILDVETMVEILRAQGCHVMIDGSQIRVRANTMDTVRIPADLVHKMRSSIILMGAVLARMGEVLISYPGGCSIGNRPINYHLKALRRLGYSVEEEHGEIRCSGKAKGGVINLDFPSVGATENIMLAGVFAEGTVYICNAAKEPEIVDLANMLGAMGARVSGAGTDIITIQGVSRLHGVRYPIIPDRIVAGTYLIAAAATGGSVELTNVRTADLVALLEKLKEMNCTVLDCGTEVSLIAPASLMPTDIQTLPHPGFPTDLQAPLMTMMTQAAGTSIVRETIFEARYKHVPELIRMGADIAVEGQIAVVRGKTPLKGANVSAMDLRGGAALVLAGLCAEGETQIFQPEHIERGYEHIVEDLRSLGAQIDEG